MKIEISYKNSLIGSLSAGESLALHLNGSKLTEDLVVRAVAEEIPKLLAPTLSISGDIISITNNNDVGVGYWVYVNGELAVTITATNSTAVDMSGLDLEAGTYSVYLVAVLDGYENSEPSNAVEYVVEESVPTNLAGYTVSLPKQWACDADFANFNISGSVSYSTDGINLTTKNFVRLDFGYNTRFGYSSANCITAVPSTGDSKSTAISNSLALTFIFTGGNDVKNSTLIQWFVDNNATFTKS